MRVPCLLLLTIGLLAQGCTQTWFERGRLVKAEGVVLQGWEPTGIVDFHVTNESTLVEDGAMMVRVRQQERPIYLARRAVYEKVKMVQRVSVCGVLLVGGMVVLVVGLVVWLGPEALLCVTLPAAGGGSIHEAPVGTVVKGEFILEEDSRFVGEETEVRDRDLNGTTVIVRMHGEDQRYVLGREATIRVELRGAAKKGGPFHVRFRLGDSRRDYRVSAELAASLAEDDR